MGGAPRPRARPLKSFPRSTPGICPLGSWNSPCGGGMNGLRRRRRGPPNRALGNGAVSGNRRRPILRGSRCPRNRPSMRMNAIAGSPGSSRRNAKSLSGLSRGPRRHPFGIRHPPRPRPSPHPRPSGPQSIPRPPPGPPPPSRGIGPTRRIGGRPINMSPRLPGMGPPPPPTSSRRPPPPPSRRGQTRVIGPRSMGGGIGRRMSPRRLPGGVRNGRISPSPSKGRF